LTTKHINDLGIYTSLKKRQYLIGKAWYTSTYDTISNRGDNIHTIGIESCINKGTDIYINIQRLAKLVASVLNK